MKMCFLQKISDANKCTVRRVKTELMDLVEEKKFLFGESFFSIHYLLQKWGVVVAKCGLGELLETT